LYFSISCFRYIWPASTLALASKGSAMASCSIVAGMNCMSPWLLWLSGTGIEGGLLLNDGAQEFGLQFLGLGGTVNDGPTAASAIGSHAGGSSPAF
jgi:hypothetical protein